MEDLPTPLSRVELYLAKACGMDVTVPEAPLSRLEQFLAVIAGDTSVELPTPYSLTEMWLAFVAGITPDPLLEVIGAHYIDNQKVDTRYLAVASGMDGVTLPAAPQNRKEQYWAYIAGNAPIHGVLKYVTGSSFTLTDVVSGIKELQYVYGDTTQQTYSGKNLYNATLSETTNNGVTYSANNSEISLNGTPTTSFSINFGNTSVKAGTYTMTIELASGTVTSTGTGINIYVFGTNISTSPGYANITNASPKASFAVTISSDTTNLHIQVYGRTSEEYTNIKLKYQLVAGSTADYDFEPYVGGTPSPNPDYPQDINVVTGEQTVTVTGKNLFDFSTVVMGDAGGAFTAIRASSRQVYYLKAGTYTFTTNMSDTYNYAITTCNTAPPYNSYPSWTFNPGWMSDQIYTFTTTQDGYLTISYKEASNGNFTLTDIQQFSYQLEKGVSPSSYESYQSQDYTVNLNGKNLLDMTTLVNGYVAASGTFETIHPLAEMRSGFIKVIPNTTYTFSIIETSASNQSWFGVGEYSSDNTSSFIRRDTNTVGTATSITFTTSATTNYAVVSARNMIGATKVQLEQGSSTTSYTPYHAPIELCKIGDYQDYIYKSDDDWYVHKETGKYTFTGSETFNKSGYATATSWVMWWVTSALAIDVSVNNGFCEFGKVRYLNAISSVDSGVVYNNTTGSTFVKLLKTMITGWDESATDSQKISLASAMIAGKSFYYPLATPTDTKITDSTLIGELEGLGSLVLPKPTAIGTITAAGTNLPAIIKFSYYGSSEE